MAAIYSFDIDLADHDRQVYETLALRVARHPSESEPFLVTRVLAYALEYVEGIAFSPGGLSDPDEPAITVRDLTGAVRVWVELGLPDAARLHRASKASPRVAAYAHKDPVQLIERLAGERIHRVDEIELYTLGRDFLADLSGRLERRMTFALSVSYRELHLTMGSETIVGHMLRHPIRPRSRV